MDKQAANQYCTQKAIDIVCANRNLPALKNGMRAEYNGTSALVWGGVPSSHLFDTPEKEDVRATDEGEAAHLDTLVLKPEERGDLFFADPSKYLTVFDRDGNIVYQSPRG